jgi:hypothetical protein
MSLVAQLLVLLDPDIFLAALSQTLEIKILLSKLEIVFHSSKKKKGQPHFCSVCSAFWKINDITYSGTA